MQKETTIKITRDYTDAPGDRYRTNGPCSGEEFREEYLLPALQKYEKIIIDLSGIYGMSSGFGSEAFEMLIEKDGFSYAELQRRLKIIADDNNAEDIDMLWSYMHRAEERKTNTHDQTEPRPTHT